MEFSKYWKDIKTALDRVSSQREYTRLLEFENRDLQIREGKHDCFAIYQRLLSENPGLAEKAPYNSQEVLIDFFDEKRAELDAHPMAKSLLFYYFIKYRGYRLDFLHLLSYRALTFRCS